MVLGETRQFTVVDERGQPTNDATWSVDVSSRAAITGDPSPRLTATGIGAVTLTASIGAVSTNAQVTIVAGPIAEGSARWSVPAAAGATSRQVIRSEGWGGRGPALFAIDSSPTTTLIRGLTLDGQQTWQTAIAGPVSQVTPNGRGGVLLAMYSGCDATHPMELRSLDGATGLVAWQFSGLLACPSEPPQVALKHDGGLSITTAGNFSGFPSLMMLDGASGEPLAVPAVPPSTFTSFNGQQSQGYSRVGPPMVDPSGATYLLYEVRNVAYPPEVTQTGIWLMKIEADGTSATTLISSSTQNVNQFPGRVIPDEHGGVVATWTYNPALGTPDPNPLRAAHLTESGRRPPGIE